MSPGAPLGPRPWAEPRARVRPGAPPWWRRARSLVAAGVAAALVASFIGFIATFATYAIWPGEAKVIGAWVCPDTHPDMVISHETYQAADGGTAIEDGVKCLDDRGDVVPRGYGYVVGRLGLIHSACVFVLMFVVGRLVLRSRRR